MQVSLLATFDTLHLKHLHKFPCFLHKSSIYKISLSKPADYIFISFLSRQVRVLPSTNRNSTDPSAG